MNKGFGIVIIAILFSISSASAQEGATEKLEPLMPQSGSSVSCSRGGLSPACAMSSVAKMAGSWALTIVRMPLDGIPALQDTPFGMIPMVQPLEKRPCPRAIKALIQGVNRKPGEIAGGQTDFPSAESQSQASQKKITDHLAALTRPGECGPGEGKLCDTFEGIQAL